MDPSKAASAAAQAVIPPIRSKRLFGSLRGGSGLKINPTNKGGDWKWGAIALLSATTIATAGILVSQWHYAVIGRTVSGDVVHFLEDTGATRNHGTIQGGALSVPMTVGKAVVVTVCRALGIVKTIMDDEDKKKKKTTKKDSEKEKRGEESDESSLSQSDASPPSPSPRRAVAEVSAIPEPKLNQALMVPENTRESSEPSQEQKFNAYNGNDHISAMRSKHSPHPPIASTAHQGEEVGDMGPESGEE